MKFEVTKFSVFNLVFIAMLACFLSMKTLVITQDNYGTQNGKIRITGVVNDSSLIAKSQKLKIFLNYETADVSILLNESTIFTGIDSIDNKLKMRLNEKIKFIGKLGVDFIDTENHPPQEFFVEGDLTLGQTTNWISGTGRLEHIYTDMYSCMLSINFCLNLKEMGIELDLPGLEDEINVDIIQAILHKRLNDIER